MSKILDDLIASSVGLGECLERLLVIANKIKNEDLAKWCTGELMGYQKSDTLPEYRVGTSDFITYSGFSGMVQVKNQPLGLGYLSKETLNKVSEIKIWENIRVVDERKNGKDEMMRDLTFLASEVAKNTKASDPFGNGVQCFSIQQPIPSEFYSEVYSAVRVRAINMLCALEKAGVDLDKNDVSKALRKIDFSKENEAMYRRIVVEGTVYEPVYGNHGFFWSFVVPILTAIVAGIAMYFLTKYCLP